MLLVLHLYLRTHGFLDSAVDGNELGHHGIHQIAVVIKRHRLHMCPTQTQQEQQIKMPNNDEQNASVVLNWIRILRLKDTQSTTPSQLSPKYFSVTRAQRSDKDEDARSLP